MLTYNTEQPNAAFAQLIVQTEDMRDIPDVEARILDYLALDYPHVQARSDRIVFGPPSGAQLEARFQGPTRVFCANWARRRSCACARRPACAICAPTGAIRR